MNGFSTWLEIAFFTCLIAVPGDNAAPENVATSTTQRVSLKNSDYERKNRAIIEYLKSFNQPLPSELALRDEYWGYFTHGFEKSLFIPCNPTDHEFVSEKKEIRAWVNGVYEEEEFSNYIEDEWYFVRWIGILTGPRGYGHFGMSPYKMDVEKHLCFDKLDGPGNCEGLCREMEL